MEIFFIQAGGSIDKDYFPDTKTHGYDFEINEPAVKSILAKAKPLFKFKIKSVVKKDSLDMTDKDRQKIYKVCQKIKNDKIIITHGTDRFKQTAKKLSTLKNKVIILTGSSKPEKFRDEDAAFNVGVAVGAINYLDDGVYISINGMIYPWNKYK